MASLLFEYLKNKATDDKTKDNSIYIDSEYRQYSYKDLYDLVCQKIEAFKLYKSLNDIKFLLSFNDIQSISTFITLLEIGNVPIILDGNKCKANNNKKILNSPEFKTVRDALVVSDHLNTQFDVNKIDEYIRSCYYLPSRIKSDNGLIGIHSSGSGFEPKTIFVNEKKLINKVFESKYVNEERILYNVAPLSSISGLFTNVFVPIISDNSKALLGDDFDVIDAIHSTDVYLPRNYPDIFKNTKQIKNLNIKRIFTFGGQNSLAMFDFIRSKLSLPKNVFVNVYGTTECGGLVSEIEEKDIKELHVYLCRLSEDSLLYSFDNVNMYLKTGKEVRKLTKKEFENYHIKLYTNYLPSGFTSSKITIKDGFCVGDCIVDGYHTGDIVASVDDKYYIIGRKQLLEENGYLANFDNEISALINRTCATVSDRTNDLHLIIRCSIDDNENPFKDHTRYFRNLVKESKTMIEKIEERYPMISHIEFLTSDYFVLTSGIKKPNRSSLLFSLKDSAELRFKIDNFDNFIRDYARKAFTTCLRYIPDHYIDDEYNIRINKNDISLEQLVDILNVFNVIFFYEENGYYKLINDDRAYLADNYRHRYNEIDLNYYKTYARYRLLQEKLAADNKLHALNLETEYPKIYEDFVETYVYSKVGIDNKGDTIILPYYAIEPDKNFSHLKDTEEKRNAEKIILDIIDKNYAYITFEDHAMFVPYKKIINNSRYNFLGDYIDLNEHELNFAHDIVKKAYSLKKSNSGHLDKILKL